MSTILKALKHNYAVGDTSYTFNDSNITDNAIIDVYFTKDVTYECSQTGNAVTVEIPAQTVVVGCAIVINNVDSVDYPITASDVSYFDTTVYTELLEHESEINSLGDAVGILDETKQDALTAGDNITIENNIISASGGGFAYDNIKTSTVVLSFEDAQPHTYTPLVDEDLFINMYAGNAQNRMVCKIGNLTIIDIGGVSGIHPICIGVIHVKANTPIYLNGNYCFISKVV